MSFVCTKCGRAFRTSIASAMHMDKTGEWLCYRCQGLPEDHYIVKWSEAPERPKEKTFRCRLGWHSRDGLGVCKRCGDRKW